MKARIIRPDGRYVKIEIDPKRELETLQAEVGGCVEVVTSADNTLTFWCNEEGKLLGMEPNQAATALWWVVHPIMHKVDVLVGTVVITGGCDSEGETLGLDDDQIAFLDDLFSEAVQSYS